MMGVFPFQSLGCRGIGTFASQGRMKQQNRGQITFE
jgi:hypothetical protein